MSVTPAEAVRFIGKLLDERMPESNRLQKQLRDKLPALTKMLADDFGVRRVILFGSLARGIVDEHSDIDLAVEGLSPSDYFTALTRAEDLVGTVVDLVPIEEASPSLRAIIKSKGEVLLDRK
jgi:predicted nucleotidyltransferase